MKIIIRPHYLDMLKTYRDVPLVKILAGIRRCGKSTILEMLQNDLIKSGIPADHIIRMRYTSEDFDDGRKSPVGKKPSTVCLKTPIRICM